MACQMSLEQQMDVHPSDSGTGIPPQPQSVVHGVTAQVDVYSTAISYTWRGYDQVLMVIQNSWVCLKMGYDDKQW